MRFLHVWQCEKSSSYLAGLSHHHSLLTESSQHTHAAYVCSEYACTVIMFPVVHFLSSVVSVLELQHLFSVLCTEAILSDVLHIVKIMCWFSLLYLTTCYDNIIKWSTSASCIICVNSQFIPVFMYWSWLESIEAISFFSRYPHYIFLLDSFFWHLESAI